MDAVTVGKRTEGGLLLRRKRFLLPPPCGGGEAGGLLVPQFVLSRRSALKIGGASAAALCLHGSVAPRQADAALFGVLGGALLRFAGAVFTGLVSSWLYDRIKESQWVKNSWSGVRDPDLRFHQQHAATERMVQPIEPRRDNYGRWFEVEQFGRTDLQNPIEPTFDMNAAEYVRFAGEFDDCGRPYRPASIRRPLSADDFDLLQETVRVYTAGSGWSSGPTTLTPEYAREVKDSAGNRYTGFGVDVASATSKGKNFLVGLTTSYG